MYKNSLQQLEFENFYLPFGGKLDGNNRWVKLRAMIPWHEFESMYSKKLAQSGMGAPALSIQIALGALIIKERLGTSDEETVEQIRENPYLQYFIGLTEFSNEITFDPSMFVHFRKRLDKDIVQQVNKRIFELAGEKQCSGNEDDNDNIKPDSEGSNKGKLIIDATCAPADIAYPTDLNLLSSAREKSEKIIDILHETLKGKVAKPRTYRKNARKEYLKAAKSRRLTARTRRAAVGKQLRYLRRNLKHVNKLLDYHEKGLKLLNSKQYRDLLIINELYRQQKIMFKECSSRIDDRIISISQPHVRPIVRGKAKAKTEFGAKISASVINGYTFVDLISWDSFNESERLIKQVEKFRETYGHYPESVHADQIYRNRNNLKFCKERGIRLSGARLGRPPKVTDENRAELEAAKLLARQDELDRIEIEGKFGQAKRRFSMNLVMTKLAETSECAISITVLVMNLEKWMKAIFLRMFYSLLKTEFYHEYSKAGQYFCYIAKRHRALPSKLTIFC